VVVVPDTDVDFETGNSGHPAIVGDVDLLSVHLLDPGKPADVFPSTHRTELLGCETAAFAPRPITALPKPVVK
jgi:hypothetical protein